MIERVGGFFDEFLNNSYKCHFPAKLYFGYCRRIFGKTGSERDLGLVAGVIFCSPLGFILYLVLGQNLKNKKLFIWEDLKEIGLNDLKTEQIARLKENKYDKIIEGMPRFHDLIYMFLKNNNALLTYNNDIDIFIDGKDKFEALFKDIEKAKTISICNITFFVTTTWERN